MSEHMRGGLVHSSCWLLMFSCVIRLKIIITDRLNTTATDLVHCIVVG